MPVVRLANTRSWLNSSKFEVVAIFYKLKLNLKPQPLSALPFLITLSSLDMSPLQRNKCVNLVQGLAYVEGLGNDNYCLVFYFAVPDFIVLFIFLLLCGCIFAIASPHFFLVVFISPCSYSYLLSVDPTRRGAMCKASRMMAVSCVLRPACPRRAQSVSPFD